MIFLYSINYISATFVLTMRLRFCNLHTWTTGKAGNTAPRGQVPTPPRRTYRLSGREALSNRGVGAKEAPSQARTKLTRAGIQTAGKTAADRPRRDGGRIKQGDERCGRRWVFSEAHNKTGISNLTNFLTGSDPRRCRDWGRDVPVIGRNIAVFTFVVAGAVAIGATVSIFLRSVAQRQRTCFGSRGSRVRAPQAPPFSWRYENGHGGME